MNFYKLLLSLLIVCTILGCSKDPEPSSEPDCLTQVSFDEDGTTTTLPIGGLGSGARAVFQLKDPSPFDPNGVSRAFALRLQQLTTAFDIVLELDVPDSTSCFQTGIYKTTDQINGVDGVLSFFYLKGFQSFTAGPVDGSGTLEITECDFENKTISGTFTCTLVDIFTYESIVVTNGVFENVCFVE